MKEPYIGITGFTTRHEVEAVLDIALKHSDRMAMIGVLASLKTLRGLQNRWPKRYAKAEDYSAIFIKHPRAFNLIHYNTHEKHTLYDQLAELTDVAGENLHGFQLNIAWPDPWVLAKYRLNFPGRKIVLQIGNNAYEQVGYLPAKLAKKIAEEYVGLVDYVLFDPSGGYGKLLDTLSAQQVLRALRMQDLDVGLGVAGGLSAATIDVIMPLAHYLPDLNIDADDQLHDTAGNFMLAAAVNYFIKAARMFSVAKKLSPKIFSDSQNPTAKKEEK